MILAIVFSEVASQISDIPNLRWYFKIPCIRGFFNSFYSSVSGLIDEANSQGVKQWQPCSHFWSHQEKTLACDTMELPIPSPDQCHAFLSDLFRNCRQIILDDTHAVRYPAPKHSLPLLRLWLKQSRKLPLNRESTLGMKLTSMVESTATAQCQRINSN